MTTRHTRFRLVLLAVGALAPTGVALPADLQPKTVAAFDRYVAATEAVIDAPGAPALWIDTLPRTRQQEVDDLLRSGQVVVDRTSTKDGLRDFEIPGGLVHHWVGTVFVPGGRLQDAVALLQDYGRHAEVYAPAVQRSRLLSRDGDRFRVFLRFYQKKVITVVVNSEHEAVFSRRGPGHVRSRIRSTRVAEVERPGEPTEREKPVGKDGGYLWRLNTDWRFVERDGGVYIQCESVTLTRGIPFGLGWAAGPFVNGVPRESLEFTLDTTRKALQPSSR
jgi:hypothetical protein